MNSATLLRRSEWPFLGADGGKAIYLGCVRYQQYIRNSNGSRNVNAETQWFKGQHEAIIDEELFNHCQEVRAKAAVRHSASPQVRVYPLSGLIYCAGCQHKLRAQAVHGYRYYRCRARERGEDCTESGIAADAAEGQIIEFVRTREPPADWKERALQAIGDLLGDEQVKARIAEIEAVIERMDFRWDQGFITDKDEYLQKRLSLQQELEDLKPIPVDDLEAAADLLTNFEKHWEKAENDPEEQQRLLHLIFERIWVKENAVVAVSLRPNYHVTFYQSGSDGIRTRGLGLDRANQIILVAAPILSRVYRGCLIVKPTGFRCCNGTFFLTKAYLSQIIQLTARASSKPLRQASTGNRHSKVNMILVAAGAILFAVSYLIPGSEFFKNILTIPGVLALSGAIFQYLRDEDSHRRSVELKERDQSFAIGVTSHMAQTAFDRQLAFCEKYAEAVNAISLYLVQHGPTKEVLDLVFKLSTIRDQFSLWLTEELTVKLYRFEKEVRGIGLSAAVAEIADESERIKRTNDAFNALHKVLGFDPISGPPDLEVSAAAVNEQLKRILHVADYIRLREVAVAEAMRRAGLE